VGKGQAREAGREPRKRFTGTLAIWVLNAAIVAGAVALYLFVVRNSEPLALHHRVPWWVLVPVFAFTEVFVVHVHFRRSAHSMSLGELPLVVGLLLTSPSGVVLAQVIGSGIVLALQPGRSLIRLVFNIGQYALAACVAVSVMHLLLPMGAGLGPAAWSTAFLGTVLSSAVGVMLIGCAITFS
jgi:hypothetical protein